ncbi:MAG: DUF4249 domain-containing protein [Cyclobacteriaceae bacterium]|nr:DUF4249 domain-containing protein [Cyclobacteriaceae bacterium]
MSKRWIHIAWLFLVLACEEPTNWDLNTQPTDLIVVEAQITNELKNHVVRLSRTVTGLNEKPDPVSGATVVVGTEGALALFAEFPVGSGMYYSDSVQAVVNKAYHLFINIDGKEYTASTQMVPVTPLKPLDYRLANEEKELYEINFQDSNNPSKKEYWISWGHLPEFQDQPLTETLARTYHYTLESIDVNQLFKPDKERILFPAGSFVLRRKYSMSEDQQAFYRTFLSETEWRGSVFDVQKGNVITNLSEGAIGYFAVSTVVSDTTLIMP